MADDEQQGFAAKAEESLACASSEYAHGRYNTGMNRCYYACFQMAIVALLRAGIGPRDPSTGWAHAFVQAQLSGVLINRRHLYPPDLREVLPRLVSRGGGQHR